MCSFKFHHFVLQPYILHIAISIRTPFFRLKSPFKMASSTENEVNFEPRLTIENSDLDKYYSNMSLLFFQHAIFSFVSYSKGHLYVTHSDIQTSQVCRKKQLMLRCFFNQGLFCITVLLSLP